MSVYKDKQRGTWYCKFYYLDWKGERQQEFKRGFALKKEAMEYEAQFQMNAAKSPSLKFSTLSKAFLADYKLHRRPNSYKLAETNLRLHIVPDIGDIECNKITTPMVIRAWQNRLLVKNLKSSTRQAINITFKSVLSYAVKYYNLPQNPFDKVERPSISKHVADFLEQDEWEKLSAVFDSPHHKAVYNTLYWSGMRIGELMAISLADLNFNTNTISITKQYNSDTRQIGSPKSNHSIRTITMPAFAMNIIKEYLDMLTDAPTYPFQLNTAKGYNWKLQRYCQKAGIKKITVHSLRHSHASLLLRQGTPVNLVAQRLGHSSGAITMNIYAPHVYENQDAELADMLNKLENNPA